MMFISMILTCINKIEILSGAVYELFNCKVEHFLLIVCYIDAIRHQGGAGSSSSVVKLLYDALRMRRRRRPRIS